MSNRFSIVVPMFNASKTLPRMLHSIVGQSYDNWFLVLIDDVSSQEHLEQAGKTIEAFRPLGLTEDRFLYIKRNTKHWETHNVLTGIKACRTDDIICRVDADDYLTDLDAFAFLDMAYQQYGFEAVWTAHRWNISDRNISGPIPNNVNPYEYSDWRTSHLKTFRKKLIENIPYENFLNQNNELVKRAGDRALYLPALYKAKLRAFLPRVFYHYNIDEKSGAVYQTDDAKFQKAEADFLHARGFIADGITWESMID